LGNLECAMRLLALTESTNPARTCNQAVNLKDRFRPTAATIADAVPKCARQESNHS
jgi:hypothetical protein